ncbi:thermonuclease family protein [Rhodovulum sp. PH10]|uniref:thermonuclease family protein n=1 Tax=Rhodovulum sp. PH10 TaxID=1187851 RepID=UPI00192BDC94|nr:thermonuclease family protein [Rhodovulum sp. PH10]
MLVALAAFGLAAARTWWEGPAPHAPPHADLRGAPAKIPAEVVRVVDGDTFDARLRIAPNRAITARVRLRGVDAPELHARCEEERIEAEAARDFLKRLLGDGAVTISHTGEEKYGRVLADVATGRTKNVSEALIAAGVARPYGGGHRAGWCGRG